MIKKFPMEYSLRNSDAQDKIWLESLRRETYKDLFNKTWGRWDEERHLRHFSACLEAGHIQIIEISGRPVGMLQIFESENEIKISEIQILPSRQREGLGTKILHHIITHAQKNSKNIVLSTGLKNLGAFNLYKNLGFVETERSATHVHMIYNHKPNP